MSSASWLVGYVTLPDAVMVFDGGNVNLAAGTYALRHGTAAISLIDYVNSAIDGAASAVTCTALVVMRNRLVRITLSGVADILWRTGGATADAWADALGFDDDCVGDSEYEAALISPLLFSAGFMATPKTIQGVDGYTIPHHAAYKADDGTQIYDVHYGDETWQDLSWPHIIPERMRAADALAGLFAGSGTFHDFWEQVGKYHRRFTYYEEIDEDDASTSAVTWTTGRGPYALRNVDGDWYRRNQANAELSCSLELPLIELAEVS